MITFWKIESPNTWMKCAKLALIPFLLVVLVGVLWSGAPAQPSATPVGDSVVPLPSPKKRVVVASVAPPKPIWPELGLTEIVAHNPFSGDEDKSRSDSDVTPAAAAPETPTSKQQTASARRVEVAPHRLQAIYWTTSGAVAVIDSEMVRAGDVLPDGTRVVDITKESVLVSTE